MLIEGKATVNNSDNLSVRPNNNLLLIYNRNESIKNFGNNDSIKNNWPAYLVGMAIYNTTSAYKLLDDDDIILHLLIAKFVTILTRNQRVEFGFILEMTRHQVIKKEKETEKGRKTTSTKSASSTTSTIVATCDSISTRIPHSDSDVRRWYTLGKLSISKIYHIQK